MTALTGRCHCGEVTFQIAGDLPRGTCSYYSKRGALHAYFVPAQVRITACKGNATYRWGTRRVAHYFCPTCGCAVSFKSPAFERDGSWEGKARRISINARLLDDFKAAE